MLSRSSSAYQPLEKVADEADGKKDKGKKSNQVELTSIAVISNHPFGNAPSGAAATTTVTTGSSSKSHHHHRGGGASDKLDFAVCKSEDRPQWTNFHFVMCIGVGGFLIFWFLILSKMYLPPRLQFFGFGGGGRRGENATTTIAIAAENATTTETSVFGDEFET